MDWQFKFSSIAQETESNLARVKNRLESSPRSYAAVTPKVITNGTVVGASPSMHNSHGDYLPLEQSPGVISLLQDRMDDQARAIENLMRTVSQLQGEREQDQRVIQELRGELQTISNRLVEKGVSLHTERKLEQWQHQVSSDMQMLHNQLDVYKGRRDDGSMISLTNELYENRRQMRDECEGFRRELDAIKGRIVRIELQMTSLDGDKHEMLRSQERLNRTMRDALDIHHVTSQDLNRTKDSINLDKHNLSELQSSYHSLKDKLGAIQTQLSDSTSQRSYPRRKKMTVKNQHNRSLPVRVTSPATSDLDFEITHMTKSHLVPNAVTTPTPTPTTSDLEFGLTDSDDIDLDTSDILETSDILPPPKEYSEQQDIDSEDDYLLTDLNLSAEGLSSDDDTLNLEDLK